MTHLLLVLLYTYRVIVGPFLRTLFGVSTCCRFSSTCSTYAVEQIATKGAYEGSWLTVKRLLQCHPWGGVSYV